MEIGEKNQTDEQDLRGVGEKNITPKVPENNSVMMNKRNVV